jgi:hypothetical protein
MQLPVRQGGAPPDFPQLPRLPAEGDPAMADEFFLTAFVASNGRSFFGAIYKFMREFFFRF